MEQNINIAATNTSLDDMPGEIWKDIAGFKGRYMISNYGRVKSLLKFHGTNQRIISQHISGKWKYYTVVLTRNDFTRSGSVLVHRLVAKAFIPNPNGLPIVNHKDEDKTNNRADNLEWCDNSYNVTYKTAKIRQTKSMQWYHDLIKMPVLQYDIYGTFIKEYPSLHSAMDIYGTTISNCVKGRCKSAYGFQWKYKEDSRKISAIGVIHPYREPIVLIDSNKNVVKEYKNAYDAASLSGLHYTTTCRFAHRNATRNGLSWYFKSDYEHLLGTKDNPK